MTRLVRVVDAVARRRSFAALRDALTAAGPPSCPGGSPQDAPGGGRRPSDRGRRRRDGGAERRPRRSRPPARPGSPKRVALSRGRAARRAPPHRPGRSGGQGQWLLALPAHYVAGAQVLVRSIAAETEPVHLRQRPLRPGAFAEAARRLDHDLRYTSLVPVQLARLVERAEAGLACGGATRCGASTASSSAGRR